MYKTFTELVFYFSFRRENFWNSKASLNEREYYI